VPITPPHPGDSLPRHHPGQATFGLQLRTLANCPGRQDPNVFPTDRPTARAALRSVASSRPWATTAHGGKTCPDNHRRPSAGDRENLTNRDTRVGRPHGQHREHVTVQRSWHRHRTCPKTPGQPTRCRTTTSNRPTGGRDPQVTSARPRREPDPNPLPPTVPATAPAAVPGPATGPTPGSVLSAPGRDRVRGRARDRHRLRAGGPTCDTVAVTGPGRVERAATTRVAAGTLTQRGPHDPEQVTFDGRCDNPNAPSTTPEPTSPTNSTTSALLARTRCASTLQTRGLDQPYPTGGTAAHHNGRPAAGAHRLASHPLRVVQAADQIEIVTRPDVNPDHRATSTSPTAHSTTHAGRNTGRSPTPGCAGRPRRLSEPVPGSGTPTPKTPCRGRVNNRPTSSNSTIDLENPR
jgi:hypothetical protein